MGSGKSLAAKTLEKKLKVKRLSTDELIENKEGKKIPAIFKEQGQAYFRALEGKIVKQVARRKGVIIDCGGGVVLNPENIKLLKKNGIIFYLKASPKVIYQRIKKQKNRPLLDVANPQAKITELIKKRTPLYQQADYTVDSNDADINVAVGKILQRINA